MRLYRYILNAILTLSILAGCGSGPVSDNTDPEVAAASALASRVLPAKADRFVFETLPAAEADYFTLRQEGRKIVIGGNNAGAMAVAMKGKVDAIILTGGMSYSSYVVGFLRSYLEWISDVAVMPGEFEMEALAAGALRVLSGREQAKEYTGKPTWNGFPGE